MTILEDKIISIDYGAEASKITKMMTEYLRKIAHRRGFVVAISGGIDSSVCAALAVEAVGKDRVLLLRLPESDSSYNSMSNSEKLADFLGSNVIDQNITDVLYDLGCYEWRDQAIKELFPDYNDEWKSKIVLEGGLAGKYNHYKLVVQSPDGKTMERRMEYRQYLQVVAATNYKQRVRKTIEYFHADRMNYAVVGTPNLLEYDQGFFVKNGDGSADVKPIAHLYKSQVYAMAAHLGIPDEICNSIPTTDTYSLEQGQDEFYFTLPYEKMDVALWCYIQNIPSQELSGEIAISPKQAEYVYTDIEIKRKMTRYLDMNPKVLI